MQIHNVIRRTKNKKTMLVGRGGKRGKTSGRGTKGQNSRSGHKKYPEIRDMIKKLPKLRGYAFKSYQGKPIAINVGQLEEAYKAGETVSSQTLLEKGLISLSKGRIPSVKILAQGEITKKLTVSEDCAISAEAKSKIEKASGAVLVKTLKK